MDRKEHWETIYETKSPDQVSWTQDIPKTSLDFIVATGLSKQAHIIDIGGGDSKLVDYLIEAGYENITVLDISANAIEKAKKRLGEKAEKIHWVVSDILDFIPETTYAIWHDRAAFHFLTHKEQVDKYIDIATQCVDGFLIISTFSVNGPLKCSGLDIKQYSEETMENQFQQEFEKISCKTEDHTTPFQTTQNFLSCMFKKRK